MRVGVLWSPSSSIALALTESRLHRQATYPIVKNAGRLPVPAYCAVNIPRQRPVFTAGRMQDCQVPSPETHFQESRWQRFNWTGSACCRWKTARSRSC